MIDGLEDFAGRVRGLVISLSKILTSEECAEVEHLIDHDELGEALRALAWIIVEEDKQVPREAIVAIEEFSEGLIAPEDMPTSLRGCLETKHPWPERPDFCLIGRNLERKNRAIQYGPKVSKHVLRDHIQATLHD